MTTAFVLCGGGSLGAVQVGMLQALAERRVEPDLLVGTSAGAVNAVWVGGHGMSSTSLDQLGLLWARLRRRDLFPVSAMGFLQAAAGRRSALSSSKPLGDLVRSNAGVEDLTELSTPVHLVATDLLSGTEVLLSTGDVVEAVTASAAIPGVLPPVRSGGRWLIDGAMAARTGVSQAVGLGADIVYVLPAGVPCALPRRPRSALGVAMHALTLLIEQRLIAELSDPTTGVDLRLLPPLCPLSVSAADFSRAPELIRRGRESSAAWLARGGTGRAHPEQFLRLHDHGPQHLSSRSPA